MSVSTVGSGQGGAGQAGTGQAGAGKGGGSSVADWLAAVGASSGAGQRSAGGGAEGPLSDAAQGTPAGPGPLGAKGPPAAPPAPSPGPYQPLDGDLQAALTQAKAAANYWGYAAATEGFAGEIPMDVVQQNLAASQAQVQTIESEIASTDAGPLEDKLAQAKAAANYWGYAAATEGFAGDIPMNVVQQNLVAAQAQVQSLQAQIAALNLPPPPAPAAALSVQADAAVGAGVSVIHAGRYDIYVGPDAGGTVTIRDTTTGQFLNVYAHGVIEMGGGNVASVGGAGLLLALDNGTVLDFQPSSAGTGDPALVISSGGQSVLVSGLDAPGGPAVSAPAPETIGAADGALATDGQVFMSAPSGLGSLTETAPDGTARTIDAAHPAGDLSGDALSGPQLDAALAALGNPGAGPASSPADAALAALLGQVTQPADAFPDLPSGLPAPQLVPQANIDAIQKAAMAAFIQQAQAAPDGSDLKIVFNLYKVLAIAAQVPDLAGRVNQAQAESQLQVYLQKPDVQAAMQAAIGASTQAATGLPASAIVSSLASYLTDPAVVAGLAKLRQTNPQEAQRIVDDVTGQIGFFDPAAAKAALQSYVKASLGDQSAFSQFGTLDPQSAGAAAQSLFQVIVTEGRFGVGGLSNISKALSKLTPAELGQAAQVYAQALQAASAEGATAGQSLSAVLASVNASSASGTVKNAVIAFAKTAQASGALGAISGAMAILAVVQDFTGNGTATDKTVWGRVNTAADIMSALGIVSSGADFLKFLAAPAKGLYEVAKAMGGLPPDAVGQALQGIELTNAGAVANALENNAAVMAAIHAGLGQPQQIPALAQGIADAASELGSEAGSLGTEFFSATSGGSFSSAEFASAMSEFSDEGSIYLDALSQFDGDAALGAELLAPPTPVGSEAGAPASASEIAAELEQAGVGVEEAAAAAGEIDSLVASAGESAVAGGAAGLSATALVLKGLGALGAAANFLYGVKSFDTASTDFAKGDNIAGALDVASGLGLTTGGVIGLGAAAAETAAAFGAEGALIGAFTGPAAPLIAGVASIAGFAFALGNYFHKKSEHDDAVAQVEQFLQGGVGDGKSYLT